MGVLFDRLSAAGLPVTIAEDDTGRVAFDEMTQEQKATAKLIIEDWNGVKPFEYSLSPQMPLVEVGTDAVVNITGAPNETITLNINGSDTLDVVLDASGQATETFVPSVAGEYVIKDGHGSICVIKAVD